MKQYPTATLPTLPPPHLFVEVDEGVGFGEE